MKKQQIDIYQAARSITAQLEATGEATGPSVAQDTVNHLFFGKRHPGYRASTGIVQGDAVHYAIFCDVPNFNTPIAPAEWLATK
jgi:hypothetical protein